MTSRTKGTALPMDVTTDWPAVLQSRNISQLPSPLASLVACGRLDVSGERAAAKPRLLAALPIFSDVGSNSWAFPQPILILRKAAATG